MFRDRWLQRLIIVATMVASAACDDANKRPLGETCASDSECASGLCLDNQCLDPALDSDGDGLNNAFEGLIGSDPLVADSDLDGVDDGDELTSGLELVDTDGDGMPDVIESRTADADGDCITDQYDAHDDSPSDDLSPMRDVVCSLVGLCDAQRDALSVACAAGQAECVYAAVPGWAAVEASCDGVDENCDGQVDEGFPDLDGDHVADCVDSDADGDQVGDARDNCPGLANPDQADAQQDGVGDACASGKRLVIRALPEGVDAGTPFAATVALEDDGGTTITGFHGGVTLALEDDAGGLVSASVAATDGVATITTAVATHAGADWTLVASSGPYTVSQAGFDVAPGPAAALEIVLGPAAEDALQAGEQRDAVVHAFDRYGNLATNFSGLVTLTSDDPGSDLPPAYLFTPADLGQHIFSGLVFTSAGVHSVSATSAGASGQATFEVLHAAATAITFEGAPEGIVAGDAIDLAFVLVDRFGNEVRDFVGVVTLTSDDAQATLPPPIMLATSDVGRGHFAGIRLTRPGSTTLTATFAGGSGQVTIVVATGSVAGLRFVSLPASVVAGAPFTLTLEAVDASGNVAPGYAGTVTLAVDDSGATLPASTTFVNGRSVIAGVKLVRAGVRTLEARDPAVDLTTSGLVPIIAAPAAMLLLQDLPATMTAGVPEQRTITMLDAYGNLADFDEAIDLSSDDASVHLSADPVLAMDGLATFTVAFDKAGSHTLTATKGVLSDSSTTTVVAGPQVAVRVLDLPATTVAGVDHTVQVAALDSYGNDVTSVTGSATVTSNDARFVGPTAVTFVAGRASFGARFVTAGARRVTVTHATGVGFAETTVAAAAAVRYQLTGLPSSVVAGAKQTVTALAVDPFDNVDPSYGSVSAAISSDDPALAGPPSVTFGGGTSTFTVTFNTPGTRRLTVSFGGLSGSASTSVAPADLAGVHLTGLPATLVAGESAELTLRVVDAQDHTVEAYAGSGALVASDPRATFVPDQPVFTGGVATVTITLKQVGATQVTATVGGFSDMQATTVGAAAYAGLKLVGLPASTAPGVDLPLSAVAVDAFDNVVTTQTGTVTIASSDVAYSGPTTVAYSSGVAAFTAQLHTAGSQSITVRHSGFEDSGTTSVSVGAVSAIVLTGLPVTVTAGVSASLTITAKDAFGNTVTGFSGSGTITASDATFVPSSLTFTGGVATTAVTFTKVGAKTVTATSGGFSDVAMTSVGAGPATTLVLVSDTTAIDVGVDFPVLLVVSDDLGNVVTDYVGSVDVSGAQATIDGVSVPTSITFAAADQGTRNLTVALFAAGPQALDFDGAALAGTSLSIDVTGGDGGGPAGLRLTKIGAGPDYALESMKFRVEVVDVDGAVVPAESDVAVHLRLTFSAPGPANLDGSVDDVIEAGASALLFDEVSVDRAGRYSVTATSPTLGQADLGGLFDVGYRPTDVTYLGSHQVGGCVYVDYEITGNDHTRSDIRPLVHDAHSDSYRPATQGMAPPGEASGTRQLLPGFHTFVWDARHDVGRVDLESPMVLVATTGDPRFNHSGGQSDPFVLTPELAPRAAGKTTAFFSQGEDITGGDFDGDGAADEVIALSSGISWDMAHGAGTFLGLDDDPGRRVTSGDLDYTGSDEVVVVEPASSSLRVYSWQEDLSEAQPEVFQPCGAGRPSVAAVVAVSDAEHRDLVVGCVNDDGTGELRDLARVASEWQVQHVVPFARPVRSMTIADLDLDGHLEVIVGLDGGLALVSVPAFELGQTITTSGSVTSVSAGDLDRDASGDVVAVDDGHVVVYRGQASGALLSTGPIALAASTQAYDVKVVDLDHDGLLDIALSSQDDYFGVLGGAGDLQFAPWVIDTPPAGWGRLALRGEQLVFSLMPGGRAWGRFTVTASPTCGFGNEAFMAAPPRLDGAQFTRAADVDGDGRLDLVTAGEGERGVAIALGRGDGGFQGAAVSVSDDVVRDAAVADIDGDDLPDLVLVYPGYLQVLRNTGSGGYDQLAIIDVGAPLLAVADLDGDHHADLVYVDVAGFVAIAYPDLDVADTGQLKVLQTAIEAPEQLAVASLDDAADLDLLYTRRDVDGALELCRYLSDNDGAHRHYSGLGSCGSIGVNLGPGDAATATIDQLVVEGSTTSFGRALYRIASDGSEPYVETRVVKSDADVTTALDLCPDGVSAVALGDFDPLNTQYLSLDAYEDIGATCDGGESTDRLAYLDRTTGDETAATGSLAIALGDTTAIALGDFDGNGLSDFANANGALPLFQAAPDSAQLVARLPKLASAMRDPREVIVADLSGDGVGDVITLGVEHRTSPQDGWYLNVALASPFVGSTFGDLATLTLCVGSCSAQWEVHAAIGDITGDGRPELLVTHGSDPSDGALTAYRVSRAGKLVVHPLDIDTLQPLGFLPTAIVIGDLFPDPWHSPDIAIAGNANGLGHVRVVHQTMRAGDNDILPIYREADDADLPSAIRGAYIGDFYSDDSSRELVLLANDDQRFWFLGFDGCDDEHPDCVAPVQALDAYNGLGGSYAIEGAAASGDGDLVVSVVEGIEGGYRQAVVMLTRASGDWAYQTLQARYTNTDFEPEPSLGPFIADVDGDRHDDVIVGWKDGRSWVAYTYASAFAVPAMFGGLSDVSGVRGALGDLDGNGRPDALVFERGAPRLWIINQGSPLAAGDE